MARARSLFLFVILAATSAALAAWIWQERQRAPDALVIGAVETATADQAIEIPDMPKFQPQPLDRFAAVLARPLFDPERQPTLDAPVASVIEDRALSATLHGILFADTGSVALLTGVGETTPVQVSQGGTFRGWTLLEIQPSHVVFGRDGETVTLELIYKSQAAQPPRQ